MKREFLTQFMERLIVELEREQRDGTAHVYQSTLKRLKKFANGREVSFKQLTPELLIKRLNEGLPLIYPVFSVGYTPGLIVR